MSIAAGSGAGALAEISKVKRTAAKLADGDYPEEADHTRVLAGMIRQLAEQIERLVAGEATPPTGDMAPADPASPLAARSPADDRHERERLLEEDRSPEDAPAEPAVER